MPLIGHSDEDLRNREDALREKTKDLEISKADFASQKAVFDHEKELFLLQKASVESERKQLEEDSRQLEALRQEVLRKEAAAKAQFTETQRKTFEEVIQARLDACAAREKELAEYQSDLVAREEAISKREGEVSGRELAVTKREQNADAGFADKIHAMAAETQRKEKLLAEEGERLRRRADELEEKNRSLEAQKGELATREAAVSEAEARKNNEFADQRTQLTRSLSKASQTAALELAKLRENALARQEKELSDIRTERLLELNKAVEEERSRLMEKLEADLSSRSQAADERERALDERDAKLKEERAKVDEDRRAIAADRQSHNRDVERFQRDMERQQEKLDNRKAAIDEEVESKVSESCAAERADQAALRKSNEQLKKELEKLGFLFEDFNAFKLKFGDRDPSEVLKELDKKTIDLKHANEDLASRPTQQQFDALDQERNQWKMMCQTREKAWEDSERQKREKAKLEAEKEAAESELGLMRNKADIFEKEAERFKQELERFTSAYAKPENRDARISEIRIPTIKGEEFPEAPESTPDEVKWLNGILQSCDDYGIHFPKRIMYAFHTALKTAEMSPLTVLAGVSGTGKSELPRLYSHFGGLFFEPVSVQPNWDSQESMLGFFNSIDNKFDAQPLLRFLAQSQEPWSAEYPGMKNSMCMVLLDEMNLAHPELYFAEFLSKFETRRGKKAEDIPWLDIKLGTGLEPFHLPLGRNVLWTGTMNQDETTKSLSDKVLDRAIVIFFPRPRHLVRRVALKALTRDNRGEMMHWSTWKSWLKSKSVFADRDDLIQPYQKFLEDINGYLGVAGRAIGHRVWQSVESYMSAYPGMAAAVEGNDEATLRETMHTAFEDQLVQKVMPKLRGIDTRGETKDKCLDTIRSALQEGVCAMPFNLDEDFELACKLGYGQFVWQSANYIVDESEDLVTIPESKETEPEK